MTTLRDAINSGLVAFDEDEARNHHGPDKSQSRHIEESVRAWFAASSPSPAEIEAAAASLWEGAWIAWADVLPNTRAYYLKVAERALLAGRSVHTAD